MEFYYPAMSEPVLRLNPREPGRPREARFHDHIWRTDDPREIREMRRHPAFTHGRVRERHHRPTRLPKGLKAATPRTVKELLLRLPAHPMGDAPTRTLDLTRYDFPVKELRP